MARQASDAASEAKERLRLTSELMRANATMRAAQTWRAAVVKRAAESPEKKADEVREEREVPEPAMAEPAVPVPVVPEPVAAAPVVTAPAVAVVAAPAVVEPAVDVSDATAPHPRGSVVGGAAIGFDSSPSKRASTQGMTFGGIKKYNASRERAATAVTSSPKEVTIDWAAARGGLGKQRSVKDIVSGMDSGSPAPAAAPAAAPYVAPAPSPAPTRLPTRLKPAPAPAPAPAANDGEFVVGGAAVGFDSSPSRRASTQGMQFGGIKKYNVSINA